MNKNSKLRFCKHHPDTPLTKRGKEMRCIKCASISVTRSRRNKRAILIAEFGGKCCKCGYDKCQAALHFHHKDESTKLFNVNSSTNKSLTRLREEAKKCILVCANCHAEIHYLEFDSLIDID